MTFRHVASALVLALASGCGSSSSGTGSGGSGGAGGSSAGGAAGAGGTSVAGDAGVPAVCVSKPVATSVSDVSGHFAYRWAGSQVVQAPGFTQPFTTTTVSILLVDQTQSGTTVTVHGQYCDQSIDDASSPVHVVLPDAFIQSLPPFTRTGTFAKASDGYRHFKLPGFVEVEGAHLTNPGTDALPTSASDPRVYDQDGDGQPGMTIKLTGLVDGSIYVVQRQNTSFDGVAVSADRLEGKFTYNSEQIILESDPPSIQQLSPQAQADPVACDSTFVIARVPDTADCTYVENHLKTLFP
jgi:hypothetical protein